jgi:predicted dehydrogenase
VEDKGTDRPLEHDAPDFSVGCIEFESGTVARITNSIVAGQDHSLAIFGEKGTLYTRELWDYASPVLFQSQRGTVKDLLSRARNKAERTLARYGVPRWVFGRKIPLVRAADFVRPEGGYPMDFMRGVAELAESISQGRECRLSPELGLHVTELTLTLQRPEVMGVPRSIESAIDPIDPMPWGR